MKDWHIPKLTVLLRSKPEEQVLTACKQGYGITASGPTSYEGSCTLVDGCVTCSTASLS